MTASNQHFQQFHRDLVGEVEAEQQVKLGEHLCVFDKVVSVTRLTLSLIVDAENLETLNNLVA